MLEILSCVLIFALTAANEVLYFSPLISEEMYKEEKRLAWKVIWGLRVWVGNLAIMMVLFFASVCGRQLTFYAFLIGLFTGMLVTVAANILLWRLRAPMASCHAFGPYRSPAKITPYAPRTLMQKIHVFLLNFYKPGWDV